MIEAVQGALEKETGTGPVLTHQLIYGRAAAVRTTYVFDAAGNQQRFVDPTWARTTTTWNFENQPTLYQFASSTRATYLYNGDKRRVQELA